MAADSINFGPIDFEPYEPMEGEEYMNADQLKHFRDVLQKLKVQLMEEVDRTKSHLSDDAENYADPVDRAAQEGDFSFELRTRDRERRLIKKIDEAVDRIDHKEYGYCEECDADIGIRRLEARPTATLCIDCKTFAEIKEKQLKG